MEPDNAPRPIGDARATPLPDGILTALVNDHSDSRPAMLELQGQSRQHVEWAPRYQSFDEMYADVAKPTVAASRHVKGSRPLAGPAEIGSDTASVIVSAVTN